MNDRIQNYIDKKAKLFNIAKELNKLDYAHIYEIINYCTDLALINLKYSINKLLITENINENHQKKNNS